LTLALHKRLHSRKYLYQKKWKKEQMPGFPAIFPAGDARSGGKSADLKESFIKGI
jgi:hypothetical protein